MNTIGRDTPAWRNQAFLEAFPTRESFLEYAMNSCPKYEKTTPVPDELLRRLKALCEPMERAVNMMDAARLLGEYRAASLALPSPPPLDPVEECTIASIEHRGADRWEDIVPKAAYMADMRAALRRYRELGCPEITE